jgi:hypothetical protein
MAWRLVKAQGQLYFLLFENRVLRRIFGPKREEVVGGGEDCIMRSFINLYISLYIIRVVKSRRVKEAGHVACMGDMRNIKNGRKTLNEETTLEN